MCLTVCNWNNVNIDVTIPYPFTLCSRWLLNDHYLFDLSILFINDVSIKGCLIIAHINAFENPPMCVIYHKKIKVYIVYKVKLVKLATEVEGDLKAPFSIATIPRCRGRRYSFLCIASLYPWSVPYNAYY